MSFEQDIKERGEADRELVALLKELREDLRVQLAKLQQRYEAQSATFGSYIELTEIDACIVATDCFISTVAAVAQIIDVLDTKTVQHQYIGCDYECTDCSSRSDKHSRDCIVSILRRALT